MQVCVWGGRVFSERVLFWGVTYSILKRHFSKLFHILMFDLCLLNSCPFRFYNTDYDWATLLIKG